MSNSGVLSLQPALPSTYRLRQWRAVHGAEREVYFAQEHPPGRLGLPSSTPNRRFEPFSPADFNEINNLAVLR